MVVLCIIYTSTTIKRANRRGQHTRSSGLRPVTEKLHSEAYVGISYNTL